MKLSSFLVAGLVSTSAAVMTAAESNAQSVLIPTPAATIDVASSGQSSASAGTATVSPESLDRLTVRQWVQLSANNEMKGQLVNSDSGVNVGVAGATVTILSPDSKLLTAETDQDGRFMVSGVEPGIYALVARSDNYFAVCAMHAISSSAADHDELPSEGMISAASLDFGVVRTAMTRYLSPQLDPIVDNVSSANLKKLQQVVTSDDMFQVMQADSGLNGFILMAGAVDSTLRGASDTNVFLFQNGDEVARAITDEAGQFRIEDLPAGNYSLVAVGDKGIGTVGFELMSDVATDTVSVQGADGTSLVLGGAPVDSFAMQLCLQWKP